MPYIYILKCADDSYYVGSTVNLAQRFAQHQAGTYGGYTSKRLPVTLLWSQEVQTDNDAFLLERKLKGWSRVKREALIHLRMKITLPHHRARPSTARAGRF